MLRSALREIAYGSGVLTVLHRARNRESLTVVMFHRVLPKKERAVVTADSAYTVTPEFLRACRSFFEKNYNVVSMEDVVLSRRRIKALPAWPLLITFDDGWRDNLQWGLPVLRGCPWALFVARDAVLEHPIWWQETLLWALRSGRCSAGELASIGTPAPTMAGSDASLPGELKLLLHYGALSLAERQTALAAPSAELALRSGDRLMLSSEEIKALQREGVAIGAHGISHLPLTHVSNPAAEIERSLRWLAETLGETFIPAMSFPHGRWNQDLITAAKSIGYQLLFTSDPVLNPCPSGWLESDLMGRISIECGPLTGRSGTFSPSRAGRWLYGRKRSCPSKRGT